MTDKILLNQMQFYGYHGALPEERRLGQRFSVDLELETDLFRAGQTDDLSQTVNYADVFSRVQTIVEKQSFQLIETVAEKIAADLLHAFPRIDACRVKVIKPDPPIEGHYASVAAVVERRRITAYLGLGSNMGDRAFFLEQSLDRLNELPNVQVGRCSSIYETAPYGPVTQDNFLNMAAEVMTTQPANALLAAIQKIELDLQRKRGLHWGPRTIDIDILTFGQQISRTEALALPHPEIARRGFVLKPLAEIASHLVLPGDNCSIIERWQSLEGKEGIKLWKKNNGEEKYGLFAN